MGMTTFRIAKMRREARANGQARPEPNEGKQPEERAQGQEGEGQQEAALEEMTKKELLDHAQVKGIEANDGMTKAEILGLLGGGADA